MSLASKYRKVRDVYPDSHIDAEGNIAVVGVQNDGRPVRVARLSPDRQSVLVVGAVQNPYKKGEGTGDGETVVSFTNELGKLIFTTSKGTYTANLNDPDGNGERYSDPFFKLADDNEITGSNTVTGSWAVPNIASPTDATTQAANTAFVSSHMVYSLSVMTATVYRNGQAPFLQNVSPIFNAGNGNGIAHDLLVLHGRHGGHFAPRYGTFTVGAHNLIVNEVFPGARFGGETTDSAKIDIAGITVLSNFFIFESNDFATRPLLCTVRDAPYIGFVNVYQANSGAQQDVHRFINCHIGRVGRGSESAGSPRHTLVFESCQFGQGVTSGTLTDTYAAGDLSAQYVNSIFRLYGTAKMGSMTQYGKNSFINCLVVAADGTITTLDNRPASAFGPYVVKDADGYVPEDALRPATPDDFSTIYAGIKSMIEADFVKK